MTLEELHRTVVEGFEAIDRRFAQIDERLATNDERWAQNDARLREESETTRRHFDVMVEKVEAAVRIVAEGHQHRTTIVGNHEVRLQAIEKRT